MENSDIKPSDNLKTTSKNVGFDGVIKNAHICDVVYGHIYGATPRFEDGEYINTSKIVEAGIDLQDRWYVKTLTGSRYLISSVEFNSTLPQSTASVEAAMRAKREYIDNNKDYYISLRQKMSV